MEREQKEEGTDVGEARKPNAITCSWLVAPAGFPAQSSATEVKLARQLPASFPVI